MVVLFKAAAVIFAVATYVVVVRISVYGWLPRPPSYLPGSAGWLPMARATGMWAL